MLPGVISLTQTCLWQVILLFCSLAVRGDNQFIGDGVDLQIDVVVVEGAATSFLGS